MKLNIDKMHITTEYVPGLNQEMEDTTMARKATSKIETVTKAAAETTAMVPATKPTRKAAPKKAEPERVLDFSPMGKVSEWRASRQRMAIAQAAKQARAIDRLKLEYLYYAASCFFAGVTLGVMICNWLR